MTSGWMQNWGFDDYIGLVSLAPFAKGETRRGFLWAELTASPQIALQEIRTAYMQFESEGISFKSSAVGANTDFGSIEVV
jgi:hypothetical protein